MNKQEIEKAIGTIQNDISQFKKLLIEQPNSPVRERIKSEISAYEIAVKSLTEQLTNGWIPVSQLPDGNYPVLIKVMIEGRMEPSIGSYDQFRKKWIIGNETIGWDWENDSPIDAVIEWMPLPDPWKEAL